MEQNTHKRQWIADKKKLHADEMERRGSTPAKRFAYLCIYLAIGVIPLVSLFYYGDDAVLVIQDALDIRRKGMAFGMGLMLSILFLAVVIPLLYLWLCDPYGGYNYDHAYEQAHKQGVREVLTSAYRGLRGKAGGVMKRDTLVVVSLCVGFLAICVFPISYNGLKAIAGGLCIACLCFHLNANDWRHQYEKERDKE